MPSYWKLFLTFAVVVAVSLSLHSCSSSDSSSDSSDSSTNGLADAFPSNFAIASPFSSSDSSGSSKLATKSSLISLAVEEAEELETFNEKVERIDNLITADSIDTCTFPINFFGGVGNPQCYGPTLAYTDHPDATGGPDDGQLPSGDLGIWTENDSQPGSDGNVDVPCLGAKINELISKVEGKIDFSVNLFAWLLCVANVEGEDTLPAAGETKDMTTLLNEAATSTSLDFEFTSASLQRLDDTDDGSAQYQTSVAGQIEVQDNGANKTITIDMNMRHVPEAENQYMGRIWNKISGPFDIGGNCNGEQGPSGDALIATSIGYQRLSATELRAEVDAASYCEPSIDPFTANKRLDPTDTYDQNTNPDGWSDNYNKLFLSESEDNGTSFDYRWQAGRNDSHARILFGTIAPNSDGLTEGCGYFGFDSLTRSSSELTDNVGLICNWAGPGGVHNPIAKVQRQCVLESSSTGLLESDSSRLKITYAPVNSCSYDGSGTATFGGSAAAIAADLLDRSDISGYVVPTAPEDIL